MLSSQALNVGRSLGQNLGITFDSAVRGYHVYKVVWKPTIGKKLQADQEFGNEANKFAMKVVKNNEIVGHLPREHLQTSWYFITRGRKIYMEVTAEDITAKSYVEEWRFLVGCCLVVRVK